MLKRCNFRLVNYVKKYSLRCTFVYPNIVQSNSLITRTCNNYISPAVTSNYGYYDGSDTSGIYANAASVTPTYAQGYTSGKIFLHTMDEN